MNDRAFKVALPINEEEWKDKVGKLAWRKGVKSHKETKRERETEIGGERASCTSFVICDNNPAPLSPLTSTSIHLSVCSGVRSSSPSHPFLPSLLFVFHLRHAPHTKSVNLRRINTQEKANDLSGNTRNNYARRLHLSLSASA